MRHPSAHGIDWKFVVTIASVLVAAAAIWVNGYRADRIRRRGLYAEAWSAIVRYKEFAFAVRRRDSEHPGAERVRLTTAMSDVQADIAKYQAWISNERSAEVAKRFDEVVATTRRVAGGIVRDSWNKPPIERDSEVHAPEIADALRELESGERTFLASVAKDLAWWRVFG